MRRSGRIHSPIIIPEEPPVEGEVIQAKFDAYVKEQDWLYNHRPLRADMFRWPATEATIHPLNTLIRESFERQTKKVYAGWAAWTTQQGNDWTGIPTVLGSTLGGARASTLESFEDAFGKWPEVHVPEGSKANAQATNIDKNFCIIDGPTYRTVEPGNGSNIYVHDMSQYGCGYSANSHDAVIPFNASSPAHIAGSTNIEQGGATSARIGEAPMMIRFPELYRSDVKWDDAIQHPLAFLIQGRFAHGSGEAGMAPRGTSKYGHGIVLSPADGRLPYIFPAHQGEVVGNEALGPLNEYAPPNGAWFRLDKTVFTHSFIEKLTGPNFVKAILWALVQYGAFLVDCGGAEGMTFRVESPNSYTYRGDAYATDWLKAHAKTAWLVEESSSLWAFNPFAGGLTANFFSAVQFLLPPPKPADLST